MTRSSPNRPKQLTIVLPTYCGGAFLDKQIGSVRAQSHTDWQLLIRDDGSDDETKSIIERFAAIDRRIVILDDDRGRLGVIANFSRLLERAFEDGADWIALCDQDDAWLPEKLKIMIDRIAASEPAADEAMLIHSDMIVSGPQLETLHPSLFEFAGLRHEARTPLATLLVQNFASGCSFVLNRALLEVALPIPNECAMHDWWLALCAAATGRIEFESRATSRYRQHGGNTIGAKSLRTSLGRLLRDSLTPGRRSNAEFESTLKQASALERRLRQRATEGQPNKRASISADFVSDYLRLFETDAHRLRRVSQMQQRRIRRQNGPLDLALKLKLLTSRIDLPRIPFADAEEARLSRSWEA